MHYLVFILSLALGALAFAQDDMDPLSDVPDAGEGEIQQVLEESKQNPFVVDEAAKRKPKPLVEKRAPQPSVTRAPARNIPWAGKRLPFCVKEQGACTPLQGSACFCKPE